MKRLKGFLCISSAALGILGLASCHKPRQYKEIVVLDEFDETREYNLTFWSKNDSHKAQRQVYQRAIDEFEQYYPNIHITMKEYTDYNNIYSDVISKGATAPNICVCYPDHVASYITSKNFVVPLDEYLTQPNYGLGGAQVKFDSISYDDLIKKYLNEGNINGVQYVMPFQRSSEVMYINENMITEMGYTIPSTITWDWVWEVASKSLEYNEAHNNYSDFVPFMYKSSDNMFITLCKQYGYPYTTVTEDTISLDLFDSKQNTSIINMLYDIRTKIKTDKVFKTFEQEGYPGNLFNQGKMAFLVDSTAGATWIGTTAPSQDIDESKLASEFNVVVREIPQANDGDRIMVSQGPSMCLFNSGDDDENIASWLFMQYLLTDEIQASYSMSEGYAPVTKSAINSTKWQDYINDDTKYDPNTQEAEYEHTYYVKRNASQFVIDNVENTYVTPIFNGSADVRSAAKHLIGYVYLSEYDTKAKIRRILLPDAFDKYNLSNIGKASEPTESEPDESITESNESIAESETVDDIVNNNRQIQPASIGLLVTLGVIWIGLGTYFVIKIVKTKKKE